MNQQHERKRMHLVKLRTQESEEDLRARKFEPGPQVSLFSTMRPDLVFFVQLTQMKENDFLQELTNARPGFVIDLRLSPRFDLGRLTRNAAFEHFEEVHATYVDASVPLMMGESKDLAVSRLYDLLRSVGFDRPLFFLFGSSTSSMVGEDEILQALSAIGKAHSDFELVRIPAQMEAS